MKSHLKHAQDKIALHKFCEYNRVKSYVWYHSIIQRRRINDTVRGVGEFYLSLHIVIFAIYIIFHP